MTDFNPYETPAARTDDGTPRDELDRLLRRELILEEVKHNLYPRMWFQHLAIIIFVAAVVFVSSTSSVKQCPIGVTAAVAAVIGGFSLSIYYPKPGYHLIGAISGLVVGAGAAIALVGYFALASAMLRRLLVTGELLLPFTIGGAPGFGLYYLLISWKALRDGLRERDGD